MSCDTLEEAIKEDLGSAIREYFMTLAIKMMCNGYTLDQTIETINKIADKYIEEADANVLE